MNILFLTTHLNTGGITSYVLNLAQGFVKDGHCVYVASSGGEKVSKLEQIGAKHVRTPIKTKCEVSPKLFFSYWMLRKFLKTHSIDIVHSQTRVTQVLGTFLGKSENIPHVSTCHGFFKRRLFRKIFSCWGNAVIAISPQVQEHLQSDFKISEKKIFLIPHGILMQIQTDDLSEKRKRRKKFQIAEGPVVGTVSRLSYVKGLDILIQAMKSVIAQNPKTMLLIAGEGKEQQRLHNLSRQLGVMNNIRFFSSMSEVDEFFSLLDIFVMPSRQEGLGLSVMEAQARGLAIVATRVGGLVHLVQDGITGMLVPPEDPQALSFAITGLIQDPVKVASLGNQAKSFIDKMFPFDVMIKKTLKMYRDIIDEKNTCF